MFQPQDYYKNVGYTKPSISSLDEEERDILWGCFNSTTKPSLSTLDDYTVLTVNGILNQVQKKPQLQDQMKEIKQMLNWLKRKQCTLRNQFKDIEQYKQRN